MVINLKKGCKMSNFNSKDLLSYMYRDDNTQLRFQGWIEGFSIDVDKFDGKNWYTEWSIGFEDAEFRGMTRKEASDYVRSRIVKRVGNVAYDERHLNTAFNYYEKRGMLKK